MTRDTRTLVVLLVAVLTACAASYGVYQAIGRMPVREVEVARTYVVAAVRALPTGTRVAAADLKLVAWPQSAPVPGAFATVEAVVDRGIIAPVQENEPVTESRLASIEAGAGLSPTIPDGMRAISVRVNEVVGVAGFVIPGTRVDVFATLQHGEDSLTRVVVSNVQVLTAGTRSDQDNSKAGDVIPSSVVTLLLTPQDAERVVLASTDGQLMLALRNPLDVGTTSTAGTRSATLFGESLRPAPAPHPAPTKRIERAEATPPSVAPLSVAPPAVASPPTARPPSPPYTVEAIRGAQRSEETVRRNPRE
jgi:pilus assembly protein CpaB